MPFAFLRAAAVLALGLGASSCLTYSKEPPDLLARGRVTSDFASYTIQRVGLLPVTTDSRGGATVGDETLSEAFHAELASSTDYTIVPLTGQDLLEVEDLEPFRRGLYDPGTLLELRERFRLDALAVASVTSRRVVPPQRLGVQLDLVSCETGATLWSAGVMVDAADQATRRSLARWAEQYTDLETGSELVMLSPRRFARFAAWQLTQLL